MNEADAGAARPLLLRFPIREQIVFAKRLAILMRSGIPLRDALIMLDMKHASRSAAYIFERIIADVSRGMTLSASMAEFSRIFGAFSINMLRVGETSGTLHHNLAYLSEELKKKDALKKKVIGALVYPAVIVVATVGISVMLTVVIFPKIMPIFAGFKEQLPITTRIVIAISGFLITDGAWLVLSFITLAIALPFIARHPHARRLLDKIIISIPLIGRLSRYYHLATIARTTGLLLKGDVRIVHALEVVADSTQNSMYRASLREITDAVARGGQLSVQLQHYPSLFPPLATQMIAVGEATGDLAGSLMDLSDMYEDEINDLTKNLTTLLEPVLMLVMGIIVGFIAISIITPIYGITQNLTPQ